MEENTTSRAEAERLVGIAEKLLHGRDFNGSRDFAILAQDADPFNDASDQILAVADVLLASEKRINNHRDWYAILQLDRSSPDLDLIRRQYRRLALLLHPDKNGFPFADAAFRLVADSWSVMSDPTRKSLYDNELSMFSKVDLPPPTTFWTVCPYCYNLYEYARVYEDCCLRCQNCKRAFHAVTIPTLPPLVAGKEAYHCCWSFFPLPSVVANLEAAKKEGASTGRMPTPPQADLGSGSDGFVDFSGGDLNQTQKKRGRPRKNMQG